MRQAISPPSIDDITKIAETELARIPEALRRYLGNVVIRVEDFPDEEVEIEMGLESPFDLLGLYRGVPRPGRSVLDPSGMPDLIFLYRRPLLDYWCETGEPLGDVVRHVLIHEIGHHFGFSDAEMERLSAPEA